MATDLVQLASKYIPSACPIGWYLSEKLDGMRCWWDGGVTVGRWADEVPWANTEKDKRRFRSTGLWSRRGKVVHAPEYWVAELPPIPLDGELWLGRGCFQQLMSIVRRSVNIRDTDWLDVHFKVFDSPTMSKIPGFQRYQYFQIAEIANDYTGIYKELATTLEKNRVSSIIDQIVIEDKQQIDDFFVTVLQSGGEGVVFRHPTLLWRPGRVQHLLKMKGVNDAEGVVVGYTEGKGRHAGRLGALTLRFNGHLFDLSGFTDDERDNARELFPLGSVVTFTYRELSDQGVPKEARYFRRRC